jgi:hypothetical protein
LYNAPVVGSRNECKPGSRKGFLKTERDAHDLTLLSLISDTVAEQVRSLSDKLNLSVNEVLTQGVELLQHGGLERHRRNIQKYWQAVSPEERKARASRASRARWDRLKEKGASDVKEGQAPDEKAEPKAAGK